MNLLIKHRSVHYKKYILKSIVLPNKKLNYPSKRLSLIVVVFLACYVSIKSAKAYDIEQNFILSSLTDYDTNPTLADKNKQSIFRFTLTPTYSIGKLDENQKINFDASLNIQRSSNPKISADRKDPRLNLAWLYNGEINQYNLDFGYSKASTRQSELTESGFIQQDGSVLSKNIAAGWGRTITERLNSKVSASYSDSTFTGSSLNNYTSKQLSGNLNYAYSEYFSPYLQTSIIDYKTQLNSKPTTSTNYSIGSTLLVNERLDLNLNLGLNHTSTAGNGWIGLLAGHYKSAYSSLSASLARSVNPTGLTDLQKTDSLVLSYTFDLSDVSAIGSSVNFLKSDAITSNKVRQIDAFYSRTLNPQWNLRLIASDKNYETGLTAAHGNVLGFSLTYQTPTF